MGEWGKPCGRRSATMTRTPQIIAQRLCFPAVRREFAGPDPAQLSMWTPDRPGRCGKAGASDGLGPGGRLGAGGLTTLAENSLPEGSASVGVVLGLLGSGTYGDRLANQHPSRAWAHPRSGGDSLQHTMTEPFRII